MDKIYLEDVMEKANKKYDAIKHTKGGNPVYAYLIESDQVRCIAEALIEEINRVLEEKE